MEKKINARKKAQRLARQRKMRNRRIALTICLILAIMLVSVGGTIAWLTANTAPVVNTFSVGDINITLTESENLDLKVIPGKTITKDPVATVVADSEDCYLFVKVVKENWNSKMTYAPAADWIKLEGVTDEVYYRHVDASDEDQAFDVLASDAINVSGGLTAAECEAMEAAAPKMTFTAYAIQSNNLTTADMVEIWGLAQAA